MENQNHRLNSNQTTNPVQDSNTINQNDLNLSQSESNPDLNNTNFQEAKQQDEKNQANGHANKQNNNKFDITDLKKNPELYQKILNEAIQLENDNIKPKSYLFSFRIHYKTHFGDKLVIVGSEEFLGNWDPCKGLELEWTQGNFWSVEIPLAEGELTSFHYKYTCFRRNGVVWEGGDDRYLSIEEGIKKGSRIVIKREDSWQR